MQIVLDTESNPTGPLSNFQIGYVFFRVFTGANLFFHGFIDCGNTHNRTVLHLAYYVRKLRIKLSSMVDDFPQRPCKGRLCKP